MTETVNLLAFLGLVVTLLLVWQQSWTARRRLFVAQSLLLALLAIAVAVLARKPTLLAVAVIVVALKAWIVPRVLGRLAHGGPARAGLPGRSVGLPLLAAGALVLVAYVVMLPVTRTMALPTGDAIPLAFAMALIGLFVCVTGREVLDQILGFLMFENGIFGLALLATYGLPGLVEAGVFLDVLVIVLLMEGVVVQLRRTPEPRVADRLRELHG